MSPMKEFMTIMPFFEMPVSGGRERRARAAGGGGGSGARVSGGARREAGERAAQAARSALPPSTAGVLTGVHLLEHLEDVR
jgi:hypothetical protein